MKSGKNMLLSAALLGLFAIAGTALVVLTFYSTSDRVAQNKRDYTLRKLHQLISEDEHDNEIENDIIRVSDPLLGSKKSVTVYRATKKGKPVAAIIQSIAPDGYSGKIELLVAIKHNGKVAGVRIVAHRETPGLGDVIEVRKSDWITQFHGKSARRPYPKNWKVKRDGGKFDQITSATITSRAVVKAVYNTLQYFNHHRDALFVKAAK